jgi:hypothetical protein
LRFADWKVSSHLVEVLLQPARSPTGSAGGRSRIKILLYSFPVCCMAGCMATHSISQMLLLSVTPQPRRGAPASLFANLSSYIFSLLSLVISAADRV